MQLADNIAVPAPDLDRRFGGLARLYGDDGAARIRAAHVAVVGVGGVGSWIAEGLARSGVGRLTLIDMDHVAESNINRQVHATSHTLGMAKVDAMRQRITLINPACVVQTVDAFVEVGNWPGVLPGDVDAVIDACDQVRVKALMADWARRTRRLLLMVGAAGGKRHAHLVHIEDVARVTHDPLLAQVRYQLRRNFGAPKDGKAIGVPCVYSREAVVQSQATCDTAGGQGGNAAGQTDGSLNCHGYGSVVGVTATFGFSAVSWVLDKISSPSGKN